MWERLSSNYSADRNRGMRLTGNLSGEICERFPKELHIEVGALRNRFEKKRRTVQPEKSQKSDTMLTA